ncbi:MAG: hypothetical protein KBH81_01545 [Phycisphaerae bacterium]|mgnify:FL=1|jgi:hypothetical protein|nr:hypothetical protein [Phycisphaerae bacterium]HOO16149.1 hypothetical protein [Phycisphaerae bacterium]HPC22433.1 hypothetical protein [Phycisphaerae bacterium]HRS28243.1 hypothetical protein [Phycisphaerae bacterium]HRT41925.1 hypothetical protein [Phycisphaerae bacterium]
MVPIILFSLVHTILALSHAQPNTQPVPLEEPPPATQPANERSAAQVLRISLPDVRLEKASLERALIWLAETADINISVNWNRLAAFGIRPDTPVSLAGTQLTVGSYLDLLIADVNREKDKLGYEVGRNLIRIAARQDLDDELVTRTYPVHDLLQSRQGRPAQLFVGRLQDYVFTIDPFVAPGVAMPRPVTARAASAAFIGMADPPARTGESAEEERERLAAELIAAITASVEPDTWEVNGGRGTLSIFEGTLIVRNSQRVQRILGSTLLPSAP